MSDWKPDGTVIFRDYFTRPWTDKWRIRGTEYLPGKSDTVKADPRCVSQRPNGMLVLSVEHDPDGQTSDHYLTGHICTKDFTYTYGYLEALVRFRHGQGAHGCVWAQDEPVPYIVGGAEVDAGEFFGGRSLHHHVYWREAGMGAEEFAPGWNAKTPYHGDSWHKIGLGWYPDRYEFRIDRELVHVSRDGLSHHPKKVVLSMLVRNWELGALAGADMSRMKMLVDNVKVWRP